MRPGEHSFRVSAQQVHAVPRVAGRLDEPDQSSHAVVEHAQAHVVRRRPTSTSTRVASAWRATLESASRSTGEQLVARSRADAGVDGRSSARWGEAQRSGRTRGPASGCRRAASRRPRSAARRWCPGCRGWCGRGPRTACSAGAATSGRRRRGPRSCMPVAKSRWMTMSCRSRAIRSRSQVIAASHVRRPRRSGRAPGRPGRRRRGAARARRRRAAGPLG